MEPILYLVHRIPFPPNKGDKIRSYHLLRFLASRYRVYLGTFVDDPADHAHLGAIQQLCAGHKALDLSPLGARVRSLKGLLTGEALTLPYYRDAELAGWVREVVKTHGIRKAVVFSSAMVQYVETVPGMRYVADFVDADSVKWTQYGSQRAWPLSWLYRREGARLLDYERLAATRSVACLFVTQEEADLFSSLAPECEDKVLAVQNGVDTEFFSPQHQLASPFAPEETPLVFTGAMDYWPNIDAVCWFAREVLPLIAARRPEVRFYIVGMSPTPTVQALANDERVVVTGKVPDVRPYLQHAAAVVAPLRVARGIQNKVLEAMAMARPVVASPGAATGLTGTTGVEFEVAPDEQAFAAHVLSVLDRARGEAMGKRARARVLSDYDWDANLAPFAELLGDSAARPSGAPIPTAEIRRMPE